METFVRFFTELWQQVFPNLVAEFLVVVFGILFVQTVRQWQNRRRYGGWRVVVMREGAVVDVREVSVAKAKQVREMPEELSVFLKGVISGYIWLNCDLVTEGKARGLWVEDPHTRQWTIHLEKNPPKSNLPSPSSPLPPGPG